MIEVKTTVLIACPPDVVFTFLSDFSNNPLWQNGMKVCRWTSEPPLRIGSTYDQEAEFLGRPVLSKFEVIDYEPGRMVKGTTTESTFPITFTRIVAAEGSGSRVSAIIEGSASGIYKLAEPIMRRMVQRSVEQDYQRLKAVLEAA